MPKNKFVSPLDALKQSGDEGVYAKFTMGELETELRRLEGLIAALPKKTGRPTREVTELYKQQELVSTVISTRRLSRKLIHNEISVAGPGELKASPKKQMPQGRLTMEARSRGGKSSAIASQIGQMIREIGGEVVDPATGWTRVEAMIRRLYVDAINGKQASAEVLLERGWGKVPAPVQIDLKAEFTAILSSAGLSLEEAMSDPILLQIGKEAGVIEGDYVEVAPPVQEELA